MHLPGATQPGSKHHQIAGPEPHRLTALGRDADITLQQLAGLLLVLGPGEGADPTAPGGPARHTQALQLGRIRVGRDGEVVGHGGVQKNWVHFEQAPLAIGRQGVGESLCRRCSRPLHCHLLSKFFCTTLFML